MPISTRVSQNKVEVKITNASPERDDDRKRGPRYEYSDRPETFALIKQLVGALERLDNR